MDYFFGKLLEFNRLQLDKEEWNHCFRVLRKKERDIIGVLDGKGNVWEGRINQNSQQTGEIDLHAEVETSMLAKRDYVLHIAVAPPKSSEKMEWFVEKAVETGVDKISLLFTKRTERKQFNLEKLEKIAKSAIKQSGQTVLPIIQSIHFKEFIKEEDTQSKYIASCENASDAVLLSSIANTNACCVCIGPEGDFTAEEYIEARKYGFVPLSLGKQRFKTETAAILVVMARLSYSS
jgi:16S rRNA (uracil1498-N3)-methyltransferase